MPRYVMAIDASKCLNCKACLIACQQRNAVPYGLSRNWVRETPDTASPSGWRYQPGACMHCDEPSCVDACPTHATYKAEDGVVMVDETRCIACGSCRKTGKCIFDDAVNQATEAFRQADGLVAASPVYYASANATLVAFLDRLFYSTGFDKRMKVGASVVVARRGGCSATFDELNKYFTISGMPVASSHYWNSVHGRAPGEAAQDLEGIATVRNLAKNMTFLMKSIALGKAQFGLPELDPVTPTHFIR